MKAFCQLCKEEGHWSAQCPRIKATSHGKTHGAGLVSTAKPKSTVEHPVTPAVCRDCTKLRAEIALLKAEIVAHAAELEGLLAVAVASTPVVPTSSNDINVVSTSSKEQECPECLKRKQKRAQSQKQWRRKTKPAAKPRQPTL